MPWSSPRMHPEATVCVDGARHARLKPVASAIRSAKPPATAVMSNDGMCLFATKYTLWRSCTQSHRNVAPLKSLLVAMRPTTAAMRWTESAVAPGIGDALMSRRRASDTGYRGHDGSLPYAAHPSQQAYESTGIGMETAERIRQDLLQVRVYARFAKFAIRTEQLLCGSLMIYQMLRQQTAHAMNY